jgi:membrane protease YdiL (CAAX protease family)
VTAIRRLAWFVALLAAASLVFIVFGNYYPLFDGAADLTGRLALGALLLAAALYFRRSPGLRAYWLLPCGFFAALAAISVDYYLGLSKWILPALGIPAESPAGWAIDKLESSLLGVAVVLLVNWLFGNSLASLYWRRGRLGFGLAVGLGVMLVVLLTLIPFATFAFKGRDLTWERMLPWMPWVAMFVLANALNEETLYRGLLLGKYQPLVGVFPANLAAAIPFTLSHAPTAYATDQLPFLLATFLCALAWGWLMQKTGSLWGSVLFHAAMDIPIVVGIFSAV